MRGRGDGRAKLGSTGGRSVSLSVALGSLALATLLASSSSSLFRRGEVYQDFPYFCGPVGVTPPSRKELMWGLHRGGIRWWEGVVSRGGLLLGLLLGPIGAAHGGRA